MPTGPKPKTARNRLQKAPRTIPIEQIEPTSALTVEALTEFYRLATVLDNRQTLDRVNVGVLTECARIKALLDRAQDDTDDLAGNLDDDKVRMVTALNSHRLALLRALGLTLMPSRSVVKTTLKNPETADPLAELIKFRV
jgi:hypothetical protein